MSACIPARGVKSTTSSSIRISTWSLSCSTGRPFLTTTMGRALPRSSSRRTAQDQLTGGGGAPAWGIARLRIGLRLSPIDDRQLEVHQDDVRPIGRCALATLLAVFCPQDLEIAEQLEPHLEHVEVVVVVFDVENLDHDAADSRLMVAPAFRPSRESDARQPPNGGCPPPFARHDFFPYPSWAEAIGCARPDTCLADSRLRRGIGP